MFHKSNLLVATTICGVFSVQTSLAQSDENLQDRINNLESRIAHLNTGGGNSWLTQTRASEIRALVADVLADADSRTSLMQGGNAGWDKGFYLRSADGNFKLQLSGQIQVRWVLNVQDDDNSGLTDSTRYGFASRRTKANFAGHVVDPSWKYKIGGSFGRSDGVFSVQDAYIRKMLDNGWDVTVGQFKAPLLREELMSSSRQLAADRSLMNEEYNQDRSQGIMVQYKGEQFRFAASITDGLDKENMSALAFDTEGVAVTSRIEFLAEGTWSQFKDFTSWQDDEFGLMLGAAINYEVDEFGTAAGPEEKELTWTVDASAEFGGANLFAALVGRHLEEADADQYGIVVQGGFFIAEEWELFARYAWSDYDMPGIEDLSVITFGANNYIFGHKIKWTNDIGIGLNEVATPFESEGTGWRADVTGEDTQFVYRSQFQLLF